MGFEPDAADQIIFTLLSTDSVIAGLITPNRVSSYLPRENTVNPGQLPTTTFPVIVYNLQAGDDNQGLGTVRLLSRLTYLIKVVQFRFESDLIVSQLLKRIDEIAGKMARQVVTDVLGDSYAISGRRISPVRFMTNVPQTQDFFVYSGGLYRLDISALD